MEEYNLKYEEVKPKLNPFICVSHSNMKNNTTEKAGHGSACESCGMCTGDGDCGNEGCGHCSNF